jgi:hypothetical protein
MSCGNVPSSGSTGLAHAIGSRGKSEPLGTSNSMKCVVACSIMVQLKRYLVRVRVRGLGQGLGQGWVRVRV